MRLSFHGAARTVTGSKHLIHIHPDKKILLDCGMFQGMGRETIGLNSHWGFDPRQLDHVIISHAHIDHIGLLPKLVKDGYKGKIYCTPATGSLAKLLLLDSARIQESDVRFINKQRDREGRERVESLYTEEDAYNVFPLLETIGYGEHYKVDDGIELLYTDCGHIIGSAAINLRIKEHGAIKTLCFSGDVGRYRDMILRPPQQFPQANIIIMESTYGDRLHEQPEIANDLLYHHIINTCIKRKGKLIIPAFSLGRTQEVLYMLNRLELDNRLPDLPYYVDGMLSVNITNAVKKYPDYFNDNVQKLLRDDLDVFLFKGLKYIEEVDESKALNNSDAPCVIISSSGMAEAGRVKHHIANNIEDPRNTILFTGYCEPQSLGGRLKQKPESVNIFGKHFSVKAEIAEIASLSAHGDYKDLYRWVEEQDKEQVQKMFLVHGEYAVQSVFKKYLETKGFRNIEIPGLHQEMELV
jgi:metallo-beta-lactamase family protein